MSTEQVLELERLEKISVPHQSLIVDLHIWVGLVDLVDLVASLLKGLLGAVHCCVSLHVALHLLADLCGLYAALLGAQVLDLGN